jgi:hypothetical protein
LNLNYFAIVIKVGASSARPVQNPFSFEKKPFFFGGSGLVVGSVRTSASGVDPLTGSLSGLDIREAMVACQKDIN